MKAITHGIIVVLVTLALWGVAVNAKAGTIGDLAKVLTEHVDVVIHQGTCKIDGEGKLTSDTEKTKQVVACEAGIGGGDPTVHYVLLYINNRPDRLIRFDINSKEQSVLWRFGTEV